MSRRDIQIQRFIEQILTTEPIELDCLAVLDIVERYVESHVFGRDVGRLGVDVPLHFKHCPDCAEMFAVLAELAQLEASDLLPDINSLWNQLAGMTAPAIGGNPDPAAAGAAAGAAIAVRPASVGLLSLGDAATSPGTVTSGTVPAASSAPGATNVALQGPSLWQRLRHLFFGDAAATAAAGSQGRRPVGAAAGTVRAGAFPVFASVVALALGLGWWHAEQRADDLEARLQALDTRLSVVAERASEHTEMIAMLQRLDRVKGNRSPSGAWVKVHYSPTYGEAMVLMGKLPKIARGQKLEGWLMRNGFPPQSTGVVPDEVMHEADYWTIPCSTPMKDATTFMLTLEPEHTEVVSVALAP